MASDRYVHRLPRHHLPVPSPVLNVGWLEQENLHSLLLFLNSYFIVMFFSPMFTIHLHSSSINISKFCPVKLLPSTNFKENFYLSTHEYDVCNKFNNDEDISRI